MNIMVLIFILSIEIVYSKNGVTLDWRKVLKIGRTKRDKRAAKLLRKRMRRFDNPMEDLKI